jgi:co-chaperonin GroES (HSP10)
MQNVHMGNAIMNDDWVSDEDIKDPSPLPTLPGYHVLVRPVSIRKKTKGGIILPNKFKDDIKYLTTVGRVLAVGDTAYDDGNKFPHGPWCEVGDIVAYGRHTGHKIMYKGVGLILIFDDQVIMKVGNPEDLDMSFNLSA